MKRSTIVAILGATMALFYGAGTSAAQDPQDDQKPRPKLDGGLFDQVTRATLEGRPLPAGVRSGVLRKTGDDARACQAARNGNFRLAERLAASGAMSDSLKSGKLPAACPDPGAPVPNAATQLWPEPKAEGEVEIEAPQPGTCGEVGLWDDQRNSSSSRTSAYTIEANANVAHIPGSDVCDGGTVPQGGTQHTSLHARSTDGTLCLETVSQRFTGGFIRMWGYDCGQGGPFTFVDVPDYTADWMYLWMSTGGSGTTWATWFFRHDIGQWVFIANVENRADRMRPWIESSGYNATLERRSRFEGHLATNASGSWSPRFTCGVREAFDTHQVMRQSPTAGGSVRFEHRTSGQTCR